jgi:phage terminase small subunit
MEEEMGYDVCFLDDPRHEVFCREYAIHQNGCKAYLKAFPHVKPSTAAPNAYKLLTNTHITNRIKQITAERMDKLNVTHEKILREVAKLAFLDPRDFYHTDGSLKLITDMDPDAAAALEGAKTRVVDLESSDGVTRTVTVSEIKHANKRGALELLMRYKEMIVDRVDHGGVIGVTDDLVKLDALRDKFNGGMNRHG